MEEGKGNRDSLERECKRTLSSWKRDGIPGPHLPSVLTGITRDKWGRRCRRQNVGNSVLRVIKRKGAHELGEDDGRQRKGKV